MDIPYMTPCPECKGGRNKPPFLPVPCKTCNGSGWATREQEKEQGRSKIAVEGWVGIGIDLEDMVERKSGLVTIRAYDSYGDEAEWAEGLFPPRRVRLTIEHID